MKINPIIFIASAFILLFVFSTEFTAQGFAATLFQGEFRNNQDCTFITNARENQYENVGVWISVDRDQNANKEGYGFAGTSNVVCSKDLYANILTHTPEGQEVCFINTYPTRVFLTINDNKSLIFDSTEPEATNAILSCSGLRNQGTGLYTCLSHIGNYCINYLILIFAGLAALLYWLLQ